MAVTLSTGATYKIASAYGTSKSFTALSNAAEAVASFSTDPTLTAGDYIEVTSGWGRLDKQIVRVKSVTGTGPYLVTFEGSNTSDTSKYPSGSGTGSIRKITTWTALSQLKGISASGGDQQYADITAIDDVVERKVPTIRSAVTMDIEAYDDPSLAWYTAVQTASDSATPYGLLATFPNGSNLCANSYWGLQKVPQINKNEAMTTKISLSYAAQPMRYSN